MTTVRTKVAKSESIPASPALARIFVRAGPTSHQMDVTELRSAFLLSATFAERMQRFRDDRIGKVIARETPVPLREGPKVVLHVLPMVAFDPASNLDLVPSLANYQRHFFPLGSASGFSQSINFEGIACFPGASDSEENYSYVEVFRTGVVEAVGTSAFGGWSATPRVGVAPRLSGDSYEQDLVSRLREYLQHLRGLNVPLPYFVSLALVGCKGAKMASSQFEQGWLQMRRGIDREVLVLPEAAIQEDGVVVSDLMRPLFDSIWRACGLERSFNYDDKGKWLGR